MVTRLNDGLENAAYMAQPNIREIWNGAGFGTRPYKFIPRVVLSTNQLKIHFNHIDKTIF